MFFLIAVTWHFIRTVSNIAFNCNRQIDVESVHQKSDACLTPPLTHEKSSHPSVPREVKRSSHVPVFPALALKGFHKFFEISTRISGNDTSSRHAETAFATSAIPVAFGLELPAKQQHNRPVDERNLKALMAW